MSESKESSDRRQGARKPVSTQRTEQSGHVQQNFSHGRKNVVVVERKKTRTINIPGKEGGAAGAPGASGRTGGAQRGGAGGSQGRLSDGEVDKRAQAVLLERRRQEEETKQRAIEAEARRKSEEEEAARRREEDAAVSTTDAPAPVAEAAASDPAPASEPTPATAPMSDQPIAAPTAESNARSSAPAGDRSLPPMQRPAARTAPPREPRRDRPRDGALSTAAPQGASTGASARPKEAPVTQAKAGPAAFTGQPVRRRTLEEEEEEAKRGKLGGPGAKAPRAPIKSDDRRERGRLTVDKLLNDEQRERSLASLRRKRERDARRASGIPQSREKIVREVIVPEVITIQELANRMSEKAVDVIRFMMKQGAMHKMNDVIDADTAELIVGEFGHTVRRVSEADVEEGFIGAKDVEEKLVPRAPVVTIMGHVDHGKTSLLDAIRQANVASGEAGGITQHIGAYQVTQNGQEITFIDTPGHEAFTAMRARGAKVTDIVILVVAADDGVMPQTVEAINHAKAAGVPIIVAINKMDKPNADPTRVRTDLLQHEIVVESMGGDTIDIPVSAIKRTGLDQLLEAVLLQAEVLELKANPERSAEGFVIEAKLERGRGPVGTLLVQRGSLKVGDLVVAGSSWGRVRALIDDKGKNVVRGGPSVPVEMLGFDSAPEAGDQFAVVENEARAREITDYRVRKRREALGSAGTARTLEGMMQQLKEAGRKEFPLVVKGDVQGSLEAILGSLAKLGTDEVMARIVHSGVGQITESDVSLAQASKAIVLGFNVRANVQAKQLADSLGIEIRYYSIIYDLVDQVKAAMSGLLAPTTKENFLGYASIKKVFDISKQGKVAGCLVTEGKVERGAKVRLLRDKTVIHEGTLSILKRFKDDVKEVPVGQECGMAFANYQDIREGDEIECFQVETIARTL